SDLEPDPWAWAARETDDGEQVDVRGCQVTAVLVAMDAARWLPGTLAGLAGLTHRPTRLIAIDNGSTDGTRELLDRAQEQGLIAAIYAGQRSYGFGEAISSALEQDRSSSYEDTDTLGM